MLIDIILVAVILASGGYILFVVRGKLPRLANVNLNTLPEHQQTTIKRKILEERLKRDFRKRWNLLRDFLFIEKKRRLTGFFSGMYQKLKDLEQEYRLKSKALSVHVTQTQSLEERIATARKLIAEEHFSQAEQMLIDCLKVDEQNVKVYVLLAQVYRARGDYDHAKETLGYALKLTDNKDASIVSGLASLARARGDLQTAQQEYLRAISLDPQNHNYYVELAEVHTLLGQHETAHEAAKKAVLLAPNNPKILDFLIENCILLQDKNRAAEYLSKLIEVNPENGKIKSYKERIQSMGLQA